MSSSDLTSRINSRYSRMSKGQKLLSAYITDNYDKAVFLTADRLGKAVGVSESTVVRFAMFLGYKGYPEFQKALEAMVKEKLDETERKRLAHGRVNRSEVLSSVLNSDAEKIRRTLEQIDQEAFDLAVNLLDGAEHVYVIGLRSCEALADFLSFYLNLILPDVRQIKTTSASEIFEQLIRIGERDVIVGISFPRYSMRTLKALEFANNKSCRVITLTDSIHSPMNLYSSCNLIAESGMSSFADSLAAPLSVINALIVALLMRRQDETAKTLEELEVIREEYQTFDGDEINPVDDHIHIHYAEEET